MFRTVNLRVTCLCLLAAVSTAQALTIVGYDSATYDVYSGGYPTAPVGNSSPTFVGAGLDLSGVGWNSANPTQSFAMISDQYFVYANHYAPGSSMSFLSPVTGQVVTYAVSSTTYHFTYNGETSDFAIGKLSTALDPTLGIGSYPVLDLAQVNDYLGLPALIYGRGTNGPVLGTNVVDLLTSYDFPGSPAGEDSYGVGYSYTLSQTGDAYFQSGDSGSPTFVLWHGQLTLLGTHSVITTGDDPNYSIDNLIATYTEQMTAQGISFSAVPESSRSLLMLLGACALLVRRHRERPQTA